MSEENGQPVVVEMKQIERRFGSVVALRGVDFTVRKGEVRALMGDNGAGKSTLIKVSYRKSIRLPGARLYLTGRGWSSIRRQTQGHLASRRSIRTWRLCP